MTEEIRELDAQTREQIAAGEVIERPASAVKELVENALDADPSRIDVAVEAGGSDAITVADDGRGMDRTAVRAAVRQHTTSKLADIEDLETGVGTLGFRGEALHAIGAVSRTTITTKPREDDRAEATELVVEGGDVTDVSPAGRGPGTTVAVADLFYNVPARRKYLKRPSTEFAHVNAVVTAYALANPDVAVTLTHDGREAFATTGQGDRREAVLAVYGGDVARSMIDVEAATLPGGPLDGVEGLVSHPETTRASTEYCTAFVNGRHVRSPVVREAILDAYGTQLAPDRYPFAVLFLAIDPGAVDVNVHPRKREVRFADEDGVREQVRSAVETALLEEGLVRSSAPRGRSAPEQTTIEPGSGHDEGEGAAGDRDGPQGPDPAPAGESTDGDGDPGPTTDRPVGTPDGTEPAAERTAPASKTFAQTSPPAESDGETASAGDGSSGPDRTGTDPHEGGRQRRPVGGVDVQARLGDAAPEASFETLPSLRLLGQFRDTYAVAETDDGLVLIDQHAADERVNYERLLASVDDGSTVQGLAEPVTVELTAREAAAVQARGDVLQGLGFRAELCDDRTLTVAGVPAPLADADTETLARDVCGALADGAAPADATVAEAIDAVLADLACYPSVTGNTSLTEGSIRELLAALDDCENPYACPHGRPVLIQLEADEIEARFERDYPGH